MRLLPRLFGPRVREHRRKQAKAEAQSKRTILIEIEAPGVTRTHTGQFDPLLLELLV